MSFEDKSPEKMIVQVAIDSPLNKLFDYAWNEEFKVAPQKGHIVQVSFGRQECIGIVMQILDKTEYDLEKIKKVKAIAPLPPISSDVVAMAEFAAIYYQRPIGEVLIPSIPKLWRQINKWELLGKEKKSSKAGAKTKKIPAAGEIKKSKKYKESPHCLQFQVMLWQWQNLQQFTIKDPSVKF
jgi:primosomal protein N' (replication factor Y)